MERASRLLGRLRIPGDSIAPENLACAAWPAAVGKKIAAHTRALKMVRTSLIVEVEDAVWQRQLFALRHQIRLRLAENIGPGVVEEVEFRVAPRRRGPQRATESAPAAVADEADGIADPVLRRIYKSHRKKALA